MMKSQLHHSTVFSKMMKNKEFMQFFIVISIVETSCAAKKQQQKIKRSFIMTFEIILTNIKLFLNFLIS